MKFNNNVDVIEDDIIKLKKPLLNILLKDRTTNKNIIWATSDYEAFGTIYNSNREITVSAITKDNSKIIQPRITKAKDNQNNRTKEKAEVFTPSWICNEQNNLMDDQWFGRKNVFNISKGSTWTTITHKIEFPNEKNKTWKDYVKSTVLEITCGEAPYLVSRYDTVDGRIINVQDRIGRLDRKLRIISENIDDKHEWFIWAKEAFKTTYGYDMQGDNILLARENLLLSFADYFEEKFNSEADIQMLLDIANIISWNIWQMDGLKCVVPNSCGDEEIKFDVIIGNPPYQVSDGGGDGSSAGSIYNYIVKQSKFLEPKYLSMIIPARWYSGGKGLDNFRSNMLNDNRLSKIVDYPETSDCFPDLNIRGGVCYFLWDSDHHGDCEVTNNYRGTKSTETRPLLEEGSRTFIRYNKAISILRKVKEFNEATMDTRVSSRLPFGIPSNFADYSYEPNEENNIILYRSERGNRNDANKRVFISSKYITKNIEWKDRIKVLVSKASPGGDEYPHSIISTPILAEENSVCTETYLIVDFVDNNEMGQNLISYMKTYFFRFLVGLIKNTQNISKGVFAFVPVQDLSKPWTNEKLYDKYGLNEDEISFIESMIKPME